MSKVLSRAHPYIKLEEAMKNSLNQSLKCGKVREKSKSQYGVPTGAGNLNWRASRPQKICITSLFTKFTPSLQME